MITIFNRKELINTFSMEEQAKIRNALSAAKIDYKIKTVNMRSPSDFAAGMRNQTGTFGENPQFSYEFIFYVKKEDFEKAEGIIR